MAYRLLTFLLLLSIFVACAGESGGDLKELNLMKYDIPVSIMAPDSAKVKSGSMSGMLRDVTVLSEEDNFAVQIFSGQAFTQDVARIKGSQLELVRENPFFSRIVEEDPAGFLFENMIDSTASYGFRRVLFMGSKEIVFQNGMGRIFTEEEARRMYEAVKQ